MPELCDPLGDGPPITPYCVEACQADGAETLVDCLATHFGQDCETADGGQPSFMEIEAACDTDGGPCGQSCMGCRTTCDGEWFTCNQGCPDAGACLDCEYQCSQTLLGCQHSCQTDQSG